MIFTLRVWARCIVFISFLWYVVPWFCLLISKIQLVGVSEYFINALKLANWSLYRWFYDVMLKLWVERAHTSPLYGRKMEIPKTNVHFLFLRTFQKSVLKRDTQYEEWHDVRWDTIYKFGIPSPIKEAEYLLQSL